MKRIGGNINAELQVKSTVKNAIGESVPSWTTKYSLKGFLDYQSGDSKYTNQYTKMEESTHVFLCDYQPLDVEAEESRMIINGKRYDIMLIDNPMELNMHMEIYLKYVGAQDA